MVPEFVHISYGNSKLGKTIPSVNFPPIITCRPDAPCVKKCYATKGRFSFTHVKDLNETNYLIWRCEPERFESEVRIAAFNARFFRYFSSGDIPDKEFLLMMVRIADFLKNTSFLCFTKKYELINDYIREYGKFPENLHIVLSAWGDWLPENPYNLPVAYIAFKHQSNDNIPKNANLCPKYCGDCVMTGCSCWDLKPGESVVFAEH